MAILKKTLFKQNLDRVNTLVFDTEPDSKYFKITELPDTFTGGKNSLLIQGSEFLVNGTEVKIEIKDALGETIYYEPAKGNPESYEGVSKVISVHIYPDTSFGPCTITILGELSDYVDSNGSIIPVPDIWKDSYNVKWQRQINVNPNLRNTTKIRFYKVPQVQIEEQILPIYNRNPLITTISASVEGIAVNPAPGVDYRTFNGLVNYQLRIKDQSIFSQSMEGSKISINGLSQAYSASLSDIYTNKLAILSIPYFETSSANPNFQEVKNFETASFTASFENSAQVVDSNINTSFARIKITNLDTFTGDVHRLKIYGKSQNSLGDFELLEDVELESNDLLIASEFSSSLNVRKGIFTEPILEAFWITGSINAASSDWEIDNDTLIKSVRLVPNTDAFDDNGLMFFATSESIDFTKDTEYQLDFTPLLSSSVSNYGKLEVYLSGSSFVDTDINFGYGKKVLTLETPTNFRRFDKQQINFLPDETGNGRLFFLVKSGIWHLNDISLSTASETSFSPNEITLTVNVPNRIRDEKFEFKVEFYDINNNFVPIDLRQSYTFVGGNDLVAGKDIILILSNNAFSFRTDTSEAFPEYINFNVQTVAITGSVTFTSAAFDDTGSLIPTNLTPYPGLLEQLDANNWKLTSESFSGSLVDYKVGAIVYTASADGIERYATVYRLNEGKTGKTGPGVVYRGEWSASVDYYRTDTRRDVVLGKYWDGSTLIDRYYLCAISHTSADGQRPSDDNTGNSVGTVWPNYWEEFSAEFDSVATDILFAQDVYANRTINIGSKGGTPLIALNSDYPSGLNPKISISASNYNDTGIFLGYDAGVPKLSLRGGNNALLWNGTSLVISGSVVATSGKIAEWVIDNTSLRDEASRIILNPKTPAIEIFDNDAKKRIDVRFGELTNHLAASTNKDIDPPGTLISSNVINGPAVLTGAPVYSATTTNFTINTGEPLTYYASSLFWTAISNLISTNDTFEGNIFFTRGFEILDSTDRVINIYFGSGAEIFAPNQTISVPQRTDSNVLFTFPSTGTYKIKSFYQILGQFYSNNLFPETPTLIINGGSWDNPSFQISSEIDITELTNEGFQVLKNSNKYFRVKRDDVDTDALDVSARVGGRMIIDVEDFTKDALVLKNGNLKLENGEIITNGGGTISFSNITVTGESTFGPPELHNGRPSQVIMSTIFSGGIVRPAIRINNIPNSGDITGNKRDLQILSSGTNLGLVVQNSSSSKRYKKNIVDWNKNVLDSITKINVKEYHFNSQKDNSKKTIGFIAEDLDENNLKEFVEYDDNNQVEAIQQREIVFVLWKGIQELTKRIEELENKIGNSN
jgi:hypothetical protein